MNVYRFTCTPLYRFRIIKDQSYVSIAIHVRVLAIWLPAQRRHTVISSGKRPVSSSPYSTSTAPAKFSTSALAASQCNPILRKTRPIPALNQNWLFPTRCVGSRWLAHLQHSCFRGSDYVDLYACTPLSLLYLLEDDVVGRAPFECQAFGVSVLYIISVSGYRPWEHNQGNAVDSTANKVATVRDTTAAPAEDNISVRTAFTGVSFCVYSFFSQNVSCASLRARVSSEMAAYTLKK